MSRPELPGDISERRLVAIARGLDPAALRRVVPALLAGGVTVFEVTLDSPAALDSVAEHAATATIGAGTVMSVAEAADAAAAGARFVVSPHTDPNIVAWCAARGLAAIPGAFTPTEIVTAWDAGASAVKVFPASTGGPDFLRQLRGPLGYVPLIPTGGLTADSAAGYIEAGAVAVGIGSWLTRAPDPTTVEERARELVGALAEVVKGPKY